MKFYEKKYFEFLRNLDLFLILGIYLVISTPSSASPSPERNDSSIDHSSSPKRLNPETQQKESPGKRKKLPVDGDKQKGNVPSTYSEDITSLQKQAPSSSRSKQTKIQSFFKKQPSTSSRGDAPQDQAETSSKVLKPSHQESGDFNTQLLPQSNDEMDIESLSDDRIAIWEEVEKGIKPSQLSIYLLKKPQPLPTPSTIPEEKQREFRDFPWQFLNESKYPLVGAPDDQGRFIDGQLYRDIIDGNEEEIYVFQETGKRNTEWTKLIHAQAKKHKKCEKTHNSLHVTDQYAEPKGAVVFIKKRIGTEEQFFALTFGITGRFLLNLDCCDFSFGKHYAYNQLSINPGYKAQAFTEDNLDEKKRKREQAKFSGMVEVQRGVRTFVPRALTIADGKRQVCSFLGAHISINDKFSFETIGDKCQEALRIAKKKDYKKKYSHIDDFSPLEKKEEVDKILVQSFPQCHIEPPFDLEGGTDAQALESFELSFGLSWKNNFSSLQKSYDDFSQLASDLMQFIKENVSVKGLEKLRKLKVLGKNSSGHPIWNWRADQLISATTTYGSKTYWIEGGEVFEVHKNFIEWINKRLDNLFWARKKTSNLEIRHILPEGSPLRQLTSFLDTDKVDIYGNGIPRLSENAYNSRMAKTYPKDFRLYDAKTVRVIGDTSSYSKVEPCDLFSKEGDFIHVKRWTGSESLSYLPLQGFSSTSLLVGSPDYLTKFLTKLPDDENFTEGYEKVRGKSFRVVLAFTHPKDDVSPSVLPFNAKMALFRGLSEIEKLEIDAILISIKDDTTKRVRKKKSSLDKVSEMQSREIGTNDSSMLSLSSVPSMTYFQSLEGIEQDSMKKNSMTLTQSQPSQKDSLENYDYSQLKIPIRKDVENLPIRNKPINLVERPQESYDINNKKFRRQNVSGENLRCFFNAIGLNPKSPIKKLKNKADDPIVRYMIANEIISATANPEDIPQQVKSVIKYTLYQSKRKELDVLEKKRSEILASQNSDGNLQNPQSLPSNLQNIKQKGDVILEELRRRACSRQAFDAFVDDHIGSSNMMVALHDVKGEVSDNKNANYTSIDAIAYVNNLGIKIYQPSKEKTLHLAHEYIPENAKEITYLYHAGAHFQALVLE